MSFVATSRANFRSLLILVLLACRFAWSESACQSCLLPALTNPQRRSRGFAAVAAAQPLQLQLQLQQPRLALVTALSGVVSAKSLQTPLVRRSLAVVVVGSVVARSVLIRTRRNSSIFRSSDEEGAPDQDEGQVDEAAKPPLTSAMVATIGVYKNFISPLLPPACRFVPTCSQYGVQAIEEFGPSKGAILTAWRLLRCSPFGGKGYDPPKWPPVEYTYSSY